MWGCWGLVSHSGRSCPRWNLSQRNSTDEQGSRRPRPARVKTPKPISLAYPCRSGSESYCTFASPSDTFSEKELRSDKATDFCSLRLLPGPEEYPNDLGRVSASLVRVGVFFNSCNVWLLECMAHWCHTTPFRRPSGRGTLLCVTLLCATRLCATLLCATLWPSIEPTRQDWLGCIR